MAITPKRAAAVLIYESLVNGGLVHYLMEMAQPCLEEGLEWNMTEKREEKLKEELAKMLTPLLNKSIKISESIVDISESEVNTDY